MSTAPTGWQDPKTNWQLPDPVGISDFNRIEGNINAMEQGSRTLDPAQAPASNVGSLRQLLDWFANRIKAITGKADWYEDPPVNLAGIGGEIVLFFGNESNNGTSPRQIPVSKMTWNEKFRKGQQLYLEILASSSDGAGYCKLKDETRGVDVVTLSFTGGNNIDPILKTSAAISITNGAIISLYIWGEFETTQVNIYRAKIRAI